jgi:hypothetical protein
MFTTIEELVGEYHYTEEELGISIHSLLGHTVICQRQSISTHEQWLSKVKDRSVEFNAEKRSLDDWATLVDKYFIPDFQASLDTLTKARKDYKTLNERWIRSSGHDPKKVIRMDIPTPQTAS